MPALRASYVVSMLQPKVVADLELKRHGYHAVPLDPPFGTFMSDGSAILFPNDERRFYQQITRVSQKDAEAFPEFERVLARAADFLRPVMMRPPPALGSRRPHDLYELLREGARAAGLSASANL